VVSRRAPWDLGPLTRGLRVPFHGCPVHDEAVVEALCAVLGALVVASLATIAVYVLVSVAVVASTLRGAARSRRLADELDQVLAEILGPRTPETLAAPDRSRSARRG